MPFMPAKLLTDSSSVSHQPYMGFLILATGSIEDRSAASLCSGLHLNILWTIDPLWEVTEVLVPKGFVPLSELKYETKICCSSQAVEQLPPCESHLQTLQKLFKQRFKTHLQGYMLAFLLKLMSCFMFVCFLYRDCCVFWLCEALKHWFWKAL